MYRAVAAVVGGLSVLVFHMSTVGPVDVTLALMEQRRSHRIFLTAEKTGME